MVTVQTLPWILAQPRNELRTFDLDFFAGSSLVRDPPGFGLSSARGADAFPINASMYQYAVAWLGEIGGPLDRAKRAGQGSRVGVIAGHRDMDLSHTLAHSPSTS